MGGDTNGTVTPGGKFVIVGVGASAGGLAAFESFFSGATKCEHVEFALVLVQHLSPDHPSALADLVQRWTDLPVIQVGDAAPVEPGHVYVIPPDKELVLKDSLLLLEEPTAARGHRMLIDGFFKTLAKDCGPSSVGIILSGTGEDGAEGLRAIREAGGLAVIQRPDSAEFDEMPTNALSASGADHVCLPQEMLAIIEAFAVTPSNQMPLNTEVTSVNGDGISHDTASSLHRICEILRKRLGHDFSNYKTSTIWRRIEHRMTVRQISSIDIYIQALAASGPECEALFSDLLIGVTSFFRDASAFAALESDVLPRLLSSEEHEGAIRIWSVGCSTGEEAYSVAIAMAEAMSNSGCSPRVQIFATDIDARAIAEARIGRYPSYIAGAMPPERLDRHFVPDQGGGYFRVKKPIRDMVIFSEHSVIKDPPFSRVDLILCRNLFIYLDQNLQKNLLGIFHYALNENGYLMLGSSESIADQAQAFQVIDARAKIYHRRSGPTRLRLPSSRFSSRNPSRAGFAGASPKEKTIDGPTNRQLLERALLQRVQGVAALVEANGNILYLQGRSGAYFELAPGDAQPNNVLKLAREGLRLALSAALYQSVRTGSEVRRLAVRVKTNGEFTDVDIAVTPVTGSDADEGAGPWLVTLGPSPGSASPEPASTHGAVSDHHPDQAIDPIVASLMQELRIKEEYLEAANEQLETSVEELQSANEEMQSINEELQSANEELETSQEELQSVNEELSTVNAELQTRLADLSRVNNDMNNLLAGTGVATIFVDHDLRILRFTPAATRIINLIEPDIGRPVGHIVSNLRGYDRLENDIQSVLDTLKPCEFEVQTKSGAWYVARILPYRTLDNVIEGAVVMFLDNSAVVSAREKLRDYAERMREGLRQSDVMLFGQDTDLRYLWAEGTFPDLFTEPLINRTDFEVANPADVEALTEAKKRALSEGKPCRVALRLGNSDVQRTFELILTIYSDTNGRQMGLCGALIRLPGAP